jgi:hypothetical protein
MSGKVQAVVIALWLALTAPLTAFAADAPAARAWSSLSAEQQQLLERFRAERDKLPAER